MSTTVRKRSIVITGHKTSISLEDTFWACLKDIANTRSMNLSEVIGFLDAERKMGNLSSAVRVFVLNHYRKNAEVTSSRSMRIAHNSNEA